MDVSLILHFLLENTTVLPRHTAEQEERGRAIRRQMSERTLRRSIEEED